MSIGANKMETIAVERQMRRFSYYLFLGTNLCGQIARRSEAHKDFNSIHLLAYLSHLSMSGSLRLVCSQLVSGRRGRLDPPALAVCAGLTA